MPEQFPRSIEKGPGTPERLPGPQTCPCLFLKYGGDFFELVYDIDMLGAGVLALPAGDAARRSAENFGIVIVIDRLQEKSGRLSLLFGIIERKIFRDRDIFRASRHAIDVYKRQPLPIPRSWSVRPGM